MKNIRKHNNKMKFIIQSQSVLIELKTEELDLLIKQQKLKYLIKLANLILQLTCIFNLSKGVRKLIKKNNCQLI